MIRKEAIRIITESIDCPIVSANGFISRDLFDVCDRESNFYMIGSMGLASSIGVGIALKNPKRRVFVFDGDGNILMNLGSLVTIGSLKPRNLVHVVFDNGSHESTGGQPTNSSKISIESMAKDARYKTFSAGSRSSLHSVMRRIRRIQGPIFILVRISASQEKSRRISWTPRAIRDRFEASLEAP